MIQPVCVDGQQTRRQCHFISRRYSSISESWSEEPRHAKYMACNASFARHTYHVLRRWIPSAAGLPRSAGKSRSEARVDQKPGFCRVIPEGSWKSRTLKKTALRPAYVFGDIEEASEPRYKLSNDLGTRPRRKSNSH